MFKIFGIALLQLIVLVLIILIYVYSDKGWSVVILVVTLIMQTAISALLIKNMVEAEISTLSSQAVARAVDEIANNTLNSSSFL